MIDFDIMRWPGYVPEWALRLDAFLDRIQYKAWRGTTIVVEPQWNDEGRETRVPEVDWYGSKVAILYHWIDSQIWNQAASVFMVTTPPSVVSEVIVPVTKVRFGRPIPPWVLAGQATDDRLFEWIRREIHWIECHEADEFLLLDGEPVAHPHRIKAD